MGGVRFGVLAIRVASLPGAASGAGQGCRLRCWWWGGVGWTVPPPGGSRACQGRWWCAGRPARAWPSTSARRRRGWLRSRRPPEPALLLGLLETVGQVGVDLLQAGQLRRVGSKQRAPDTRVFMDARGAVVAGADPERDLAEDEEAEERVPLLWAEVAVFVAGAQGPPSGDEGPMVGDDVLGVDRGIPHGRVERLVTADLGGDVRGQAGADGVGDEDP